MKKLLLILIALIISIPSYAQDEIKDAVYVLNDFSGGLNTKRSDYALESNEATISENIRYNSSYKAISKRTKYNTYGTADETDPILGMHRHYKYNGDKVLIVAHGNQIDKGTDNTGAFTKILDLTTGDKRWQFVSWHDIVIGCDGYNTPIKYDGTSSSATFLGSCLATDTDAGTGPASGNRSYKVSYYTASYEVLLDTASNVVACDGDDIDLSMIPIAPDSYGGEVVVGRKIYRNKAASQTTWYLLSNGTITNNVDVTLTDSDTDAELTATTYPAGDATYSPPSGRFLIIQNDRLMFANDPQNNPSRLWYSELASHDIFVDDSYVDVRANDGDNITFIKGVLNILTIGKNNSIQKLYTDQADPTDWTKSDPFSFIGCQAPYTAVNTSQGIIYLARDGIYVFTGQYSQLISDAITPEIKDISSTDFANAWGIFHDNVYYLAYTSERSGEDHNNRVIVYDFLSDSYSIDITNINAYCSFNSGNDWGVLYSGSSIDGSVVAHSEEVYEVIHKRHSDFAGLWDDMRYIPTDAGGDSESPVLEIARTETINELTGTIDGLTGVIDRQDTQGHYVSQPFPIGSTATLDKIYWNESIPLTGGDTSVNIRSSATGEQNLLHNDDFELWDNYPYDTDTTVRPNDWTFTTSGLGTDSCTRSTTKYRGTYSAEIATAATTSGVLTYSLKNASNYQGKNMVFNGWVKSDNSVASKVGISIDDNINTQTTTYYGNSGVWENLEVTAQINASATEVTVSVIADTGTTAGLYFDQAMLIKGTTAVNDWSAWSSAYTNPSGSDISAETTNAYMQYQINMETDDITATPTIIKQDSYVVYITYDKEGTTTETEIPLHHRSGWMDLQYPHKKKLLKWIYLYYTGVSGDLVVKIENMRGDSDSFTIDLSQYKNFYTEGFTGGGLLGQEFRIDITNNDLNPVEINKIVLIFDVEPDGWKS